MSVEKIELPAFVVADLYKNCLVELPADIDSVTVVSETTKEENKTIEKDERIKFFGGNKRNIIALVNEQDAEIMNDKNLEFLTRILQACNFDLSDIAIVNIHKQLVDCTTIKAQLNAEYVLLFGVEPPLYGLPFSIPHFQVHGYDDCTFIYTPELSAFLPQTHESRLLKSKLWTSLKTAFKL